MSQQQSPPQSFADDEHVLPPLAELLSPPLLEEATAEATVLVLAVTEVWAEDCAELEATEDALELEAVEDTELEAAAPPLPPTPVGCESKSVVEPVAQLITIPKPAANAPIP
ncbi:MAG: hypothetical protein FJ096_11625, partial [Deltaproteobacteria bacterium]|nr:hypothetical protein [Deltaproteobacteria bacterium]